MTPARVLLLAALILGAPLVFAQSGEDVLFAHGEALIGNASTMLFHAPPQHAVSDFSFMKGTWHVRSHSLSERMAETETWLENTMETVFTVFLNGLVVINNTYGTFNGNPMNGLMIRAYDPDKDEWEFRWMSEGYPHLTEQVRGRFREGIGTFYGTETYRGTEYCLRFRWTKVAEDRAYWDQSYQNPETGEWQVNWILEYQRIEN